MRQKLMKLLKRRWGNYFAAVEDVRHAIRQLGYGRRTLDLERERTGVSGWARSLPAGMAAGFISILLMAVISPLTTAQTGQAGRDCDDNAIIRCGVSDLNDLKAKYRENQQGNVQTVFAAFSIPNEAALDGMVAGRVTADNEVYVGERLVATNATTVGRQNISNERGSSVDMGGGQFWQRAPSVSFADPNGSLDALVKLENNTFKYAVIKSCGNPVGANPVAPPTPPQPTPIPTPPVTPPTPTPTPPRPPRAVPAEQKRPEFEINKDVRVKGQTQWRQNVTAEAGDRLQYRIIISNTGETDLEDVLVKDRPPDGTSYSDFSLETADQPSGDLFSSGITIDTIVPDEEEEITYELLINPSTEACGSSRLRNLATAKPDNAREKDDDATAEVCPEEDEETPSRPTPPPITPAVTAPTPPPTPPAPVLAATTTVATTKATLPATGPASLVALFSITSLSGTFAHYLFAKRRNY